MLKVKTKSKYICLLSFFIANTIFADVIILNEKNVVEMALKRNEVVGITSAELQIAKTKVDASISNLYPTLSIQAQIQKTSGEGSIIPNAYQWYERGSIGLSQPLYTFGKISTAIDIAKAGTLLGKTRVEVTEAEIKNMARKLYYRVLYSKDLLHASTKSFENANENKKTLEKRVSYGRISRNDNLKMQADIASRKPFLIDAEKNLNIAKYDLINFLAIPIDSKIEFEKKSLTEISLVKKVKKENVINNLNIQLLTENLKLRKISIENEKANRMPTLSAFASFTPSNYKDGLFGDKLKDQQDLTFGVMFNFDWSLGGSQNDVVQIRKVEARIAELQLDQEKRNQRIQLLKLNKQKESLEKKLESESRAIELALSSYKVTLGAFATGGVSQLQLNDSELLLTNNRISYARTKLELLNTNLDIERISTKSSGRDE